MWAINLLKGVNKMPGPCPSPGFFDSIVDIIDEIDDVYELSQDDNKNEEVEIFCGFFQN